MSCQVLVLELSFPVRPCPVFFSDIRFRKFEDVDVQSRRSEDCSSFPRFHFRCFFFSSFALKSFSPFFPASAPPPSCCSVFLERRSDRYFFPRDRFNIDVVTLDDDTEFYFYNVFFRLPFPASPAPSLVIVCLFFCVGLASPSSFVRPLTLTEATFSFFLLLLVRVLRLLYRNISSLLPSLGFCFICSSIYYRLACFPPFHSTPTSVV